MENLLKIPAEERQSIEAGETADLPKYAASVLSNALRWSGANSPEQLGQLTEIHDEFREKHPEGGYEDWVEFYHEEYNGEERIAEATEDAYVMLKQIREAVNQLERDDVQDFVQELVLYQTYRGENIRELVVQILDRKYRPDVERVPADRDFEYVHAKVGDVRVSVQPESSGMSGKNASAEEDEDVAVVYYRQNNSNRGLRIVVSELNAALSPFRN
ncbi:MjaI family restriction endonuclease [Halolamina salifodinae]|uniref:MjaI restriction endonuclease n=1 Tax=Halolamina salifodinae TaxID=1202767 RepID=A0A8T4GVD2_9EURY|nr:MjaI family restriction endonuclease [Halolamina salifodinae]MBP1986023.1 hypothetical protein [Halolamina salifodinae]